MGYVNDSDYAKDLAQETFVIVLNKLPEFRNEAAINTWIYRIAANLCLRHLERDKKFVKKQMPESAIAEEDSNIEPKIKFLYQCISQLQELDRIIISLELENVNQEEIAAITGISNANVRVRIHRIKEKLRLKFNHYED